MSASTNELFADLLDVDFSSKPSKHAFTASVIHDLTTQSSTCGDPFAPAQVLPVQTMLSDMNINQTRLSPILNKVDHEAVREPGQCCSPAIVSNPFDIVPGVHSSSTCSSVKLDAPQKPLPPSFNPFDDIFANQTPPCLRDSRNTNPNFETKILLTAPANPTACFKPQQPDLELGHQLTAQIQQEIHGSSVPRFIDFCIDLTSGVHAPTFPFSPGFQMMPSCTAASSTTQNPAIMPTNEQHVFGMHDPWNINRENKVVDDQNTGTTLSFADFANFPPGINDVAAPAQRTSAELDTGLFCDPGHPVRQLQVCPITEGITEDVVPSPEEPHNTTNITPSNEADLDESATLNSELDDLLALGLKIVFVGLILMSFVIIVFIDSEGTCTLMSVDC